MRAWEYKLKNYKLALATLQSLRDEELNKLSEREIAGAIKQFEYTQELGWKLFNSYITEMGIETGISGSRSTIDAAFRAGLIEDYRVYHEMIDKRNLTSHIYNVAVALDIFDKIVPLYLPALEQIAQALEDERA